MVSSFCYHRAVSFYFIDESEQLLCYITDYRDNRVRLC